MNLKPVVVVWFDAVSYDEWEEIEDAKDLELHTIKTLGFLVHEDETRIIIATSWDVEREAVAGKWAIPKTWLVSMQEITLDI